MLPQAPDWLIRRFAPRVVIDVAPEAFTFSRNGASRCLATYLYVRQREGLREIVAIGQDAPGSLGVVRIDLFAAGQSTVSDLNEHLEAYLTYGLQSLHTWSLIRPFVTVRGANRLAAFLSGYEQGLLRDALGRAVCLLRNISVVTPKACANTCWLSVPPNNMVERTGPGRPAAHHER